MNWPAGATFPQNGGQQQAYGQASPPAGGGVVTRSIDDLPPQQGQQSQQPYGQQPTPGVYGQPQQPQQPQQYGVYTPSNFQQLGHGVQPLSQYQQRELQFQQQQPQQPQLPPQQFGQPQQQGFAPQQPAPGVYGPQQGQPQQQPQGPAQRVQLQDNAILDGEGVPPELRGRTWGEARRLYSALSTEWLQRNSGGRQPQQPQQPQGLPPQQWGQQPQGYGQQPQQQWGQPQQGQQPRGSFFMNPDERIAEVVRQQIEQTVLPALQPVVQQTQAQAILQARNVALTGTPDWQALEPQIMELLASADPRDLQRPEVWGAAANMVRGQLMAQGRYQPQQPRVPQPQDNGVAYGSFFAEGPTAPSAYGMGTPQGQAQPTQQDVFLAGRFGMNINDWMAYKDLQPQQQGAF